MDKLYLIDAEIRGNAVKFFFGNEENVKEAWGDDWNDRPVSINAGQVYDEYVDESQVYYFDFSCWVLDPLNDNTWNGNSFFSYEDIKDRRVPRLVISFDDYEGEYFASAANDNNIAIYYGDTARDIEKRIGSKKCGFRFID